MKKGVKSDNGRVREGAGTYFVGRAKGGTSNAERRTSNVERREEKRTAFELKRYDL